MSRLAPTGSPLGEVDEPQTDTGGHPHALVAATGLSLMVLLSRSDSSISRLAPTGSLLGEVDEPQTDTGGHPHALVVATGLFLMALRSELLAALSPILGSS